MEVFEYGLLVLQCYFYGLLTVLAFYVGALGVPVAMLGAGLFGTSVCNFFTGTDEWPCGLLCPLWALVGIAVLMIGMPLLALACASMGTWISFPAPDQISPWIGKPLVCLGVGTALVPLAWLAWGTDSF